MESALESSDPLDVNSTKDTKAEEESEVTVFIVFGLLFFFAIFGVYFFFIGFPDKSFDVLGAKVLALGYLGSLSGMIRYLAGKRLTFAAKWSTLVTMFACFCGLGSYVLETLPLGTHKFTLAILIAGVWAMRGIDLSPKLKTPLVILWLGYLMWSFPPHLPTLAIH